MTRCKDIEKSISHHHPDTPPGQVASHIENCEDCARAYQEFQQLRQLLLHYKEHSEEAWPTPSLTQTNSTSSTLWMGLAATVLLCLTAFNFILWQLLQTYTTYLNSMPL